MAIRAYDEIYLSGAQRILGDAADFAVISLGLDPDTFGNALAVSSASRQFANGNPKYVAGMNGCELARIILTETNTSFTNGVNLTKSTENSVVKPNIRSGPHCSHCSVYKCYFRMISPIDREFISIT